MIEHISMEKV